MSGAVERIEDVRRFIQNEHPMKMINKGFVMAASMLFLTFLSASVFAGTHRIEVHGHRGARAIYPENTSKDGRWNHFSRSAAPDAGESPGDEGCGIPSGAMDR
jgi:hypothetical protein